MDYEPKTIAELSEAFQTAMAAMVQSQHVALALVVSAIAEQGDAERLAETLERRLRQARIQPAFSPVAEQALREALEAAQAVATVQRRGRH